MLLLRRLVKLARAEINSWSSESNREQSAATAPPQGDPSRDASEEDWGESLEQYHYRVLEVANGSDFREIKRAHRRLLSKYHPDKFFGTDRLAHAEEVTRQVNEAYEFFKEKFRN